MFDIPPRGRYEYIDPTYTYIHIYIHTYSTYSTYIHIIPEWLRGRELRVLEYIRLRSILLDNLDGIFAIIHCYDCLLLFSSTSSVEHTYISHPWHKVGEFVISTRLVGLLPYLYNNTSRLLYRYVPLDNYK